MDTGILEKWLKSGYLEQSNWFATEAGTPQGGIISPTLANLTLDGLEVLLRQRFPQEVTRRPIRFLPKVHLVRYADDFIITGDSREMLENEVRPLVEEFLRERGLTLSAEKTHVTRIDDGFDFLGQHLRKYRGKLLVKPSRKNTKAFLTKVRGLIEDSKTVTQADLIARLNPVIRGWVNYHRHCVASHAFRRVDFEIWRKLWRWCCRRHPTKNAYWVKDRYFHAMRRRKWTFAAFTGAPKAPDRPAYTKLVYADETRIRRHLKIKGAANPFDPQWRSYFRQRSLASGSAAKNTVVTTGSLQRA
jgi:RNA-directed DNA polymerase